MIDMVACTDGYCHCFEDEKSVYIVLADFASTYYYEFRTVFIYNVAENKTNVYIFEIGDGYGCYDYPKIVKEKKPLRLEQVQKLFPENDFTEMNYGF